MGFFDKRTIKPTINPNAVGQKPTGDAYNEYVVLGIYEADGTYIAPEVVYVGLEQPDEPMRQAHRVGDVLLMTRQEAQVVGKRVALMPRLKVAE